MLDLVELLHQTQIFDPAKFTICSRHSQILSLLMFSSTPLDVVNVSVTHIQTYSYLVFVADSTCIWIMKFQISFQFFDDRKLDRLQLCLFRKLPSLHEATVGFEYKQQGSSSYIPSRFLGNNKPYMVYTLIPLEIVDLQPTFWTYDFIWVNKFINYVHIYNTTSTSLKITVCINFASIHNCCVRAVFFSTAK